MNKKVERFDVLWDFPGALNLFKCHLRFFWLFVFLLGNGIPLGAAAPDPGLVSQYVFDEETGVSIADRVGNFSLKIGNPAGVSWVEEWIEKHFKGNGKNASIVREKAHNINTMLYGECQRLYK